ncbi:hypothetical protein CL622_07560 [archaeon]|nr:hypothetical protein [archaeon]|tara:strand:+ start:412 stop:633 length:222 start_codon:yes stop_codon:yes gene_type:complete
MKKKYKLIKKVDTEYFSNIPEFPKPYPAYWTHNFGKALAIAPYHQQEKIPLLKNANKISYTSKRNDFGEIGIR